MLECTKRRRSVVQRCPAVPTAENRQALSAKSCTAPQAQCKSSIDKQCQQAGDKSAVARCYVHMKYTAA
eukprot:14335-Heterococcus_DN1.PRE.1